MRSIHRSIWDFLRYSRKRTFHSSLINYREIWVLLFVDLHLFVYVVLPLFNVRFEHLRVASRQYFNTERNRILLGSASSACE